MLFSIIFIVKILNHRNKNLPPSPFSLPIIGHLHLLNKQPLHQALHTLSSHYGTILSLKLGFRSILVVSSPSAVEERFTKNDITFANRPRTMAGQHLTYNSTVLVWAPYGHLWRNLRRVATIEIFSHISLQKSSIIREEEVYYLLRQMCKVSNIEPQKVDFKFLSTLLVSNIMMRMVAGKPCVGEEFACMDVGKQLLKEFKDSYFASSTVNICDFFPILKWVGYRAHQLENAPVSLLYSSRRDEAPLKITQGGVCTCSKWNLFLAFHIDHETIAQVSSSEVVSRVIIICASS